MDSKFHSKWVKLFAIALLGIVAFTIIPSAANADTQIQGRVVQVDLAAHAKISQYRDIDSSAVGYGKNACGLVAAAAALGGENWTGLVDELALAAGADYGNNTGIQPSNYVAALQEIFGAENVVELESTTVETLYAELQAGNVVIVDIQVNAQTVKPSAASPNYAHYARVLGIDMARGEIYIENTLSGAAYWTLSLEQFSDVWEYPETGVSLIPDYKNAEAVTQWAVVITPVAALA